MLKIQIADTDIGKEEGSLGWVCKTTGGLGDGSPPAGSRGGALVGGLGDKVPQKLKNFKSSYKQILRIFGSNSHNT